MAFTWLKCQAKIKEDLREIEANPPNGIFVDRDQEKVNVLHALIVGSEGTPYDGRFYYFVSEFPEEYPSRPPKVKLITARSEENYLVPNVEPDGTVCLDILGTEKGQAWNQNISFRDVLVSIRESMKEKLLAEEVEFFKSSENGLFRSRDWTNYLWHHTLKYSVCDILDNPEMLDMPKRLREAMESSFRENYDTYEKACRRYFRFYGPKNRDVDKYFFDYRPLRDTLRNIKRYLDAKSTPTENLQN